MVAAIHDLLLGQIFSKDIAFKATNLQCGKPAWINWCSGKEKEKILQGAPAGPAWKTNVQPAKHVWGKRANGLQEMDIGRVSSLCEGKPFRKWKTDSAVKTPENHTAFQSTAYLYTG